MSTITWGRRPPSDEAPNPEQTPESICHSGPTIARFVAGTGRRETFRSRTGPAESAGKRCYRVVHTAGSITCLLCTTDDSSVRGRHPLIGRLSTASLRLSVPCFSSASLFLNYISRPFTRDLQPEHHPYCCFGHPDRVPRQLTKSSRPRTTNMPNIVVVG
jgi:hypothetical protein